MTIPRIAHIQMGSGGGTERFFVSLVRAFAEAGAKQMVGLRSGVAYREDVADVADVIEGPFLRLTPGGIWARKRWHQMLRDFRPDAVLGWRAPTAKLMPSTPNVKKLVRLGDYPSHARHMSNLDAVICNNPDIADHMRAIGHTGRIEVISNFARPVSVSPVSRSALETPEDAFVICASARFAHNKGLDTLVRAVARLEGVWLWLVGDGEERGALEVLIRDQGIEERTRLSGWVDEPMDYIAAANCFVMPSRDEPLGNALIEAWHAGIPSVTTATAGPVWYAEHERDCLMVDVDDDAQMAAAIDRIRRDPELSQSLKTGATETLRRTFALDQVVDRYFRLFSTV